MWPNPDGVYRVVSFYWGYLMRFLSYVYGAWQHYSAPFRNADHKWDSPRNGTNVMELLVMGGTANMTVLLIGLFSISLVYGHFINKWAKMAYTGPVKLLDFLVLVCPIMLNVSYMTGPAQHMQILCVVIVLIFFFIKTLKPGEKRNEYESNMMAHCQIIYDINFIPWLTNYRAIMLITTSVCILAVDFPMFPLRFAKTVYWGQSLMDAGVGSFVFAAGIFSQEARRGLENSRLTKVIKECLPMIVLGFIRIAMVKSTGYTEEVIEYGTHWNFFFTMAFCKLTGSLVLRGGGMRYPGIASILIAISHEYLLCCWVSAEWVLSPNTPRDDFISANREGIVSIWGYVSIYLAGVWLGKVICENKRYDQELNTNLSLFISGVTSFLWMVLCIIFYNEWFIPTCRRLASASYVLWIVTYNMSLLLLFLVIDTFLLYFSDLFGTESQPPPPPNPNQGRKPRGKGKKRIQRPPPPPPPLDPEDWPTIDEMDYDGNPPHLNHRCPWTLLAVAKNGLAYFLLANLMTGIINHYILSHTEQDNEVAWYYLTTYMAVLHLAAIGSYNYGWNFKFW